MTQSIKPVLPDHRAEILRILAETRVFSPEELVVAEGLLDCWLRDGEASGYKANVFLEESAVAGYVCFGPTPLTRTTWDVYWLAVDPAKQRRGIGRELLSFAHDVIQKRGGYLVLIETSSRTEYESARNLYLSCGYKVECLISDFYAPGDSKFIFSKRLP